MLIKVIFTLSILCVFSSFCITDAISQEAIRDKRQSYGVTNGDIYKETKHLKNLLRRIEQRDVEMASSHRKTLNYLASGYSSTKRDIQTISQQLAKMEERMFAMESLMQTTDERIRHILKGLTEGVNLLIVRSNLNDIAPLPPLAPRPDSSNFGEDIKAVMKTVQTFDNTLKTDIQRIDNEVKSAHSNINNRLDELKSISNCNLENQQAMANIAGQLAKTEKEISTHINDAGQLLTKGGSSSDCSSLAKSVAQSFEKIFREQKHSQESVASARMETRQALDEQKHSISTLIEEERNERNKIQTSFQSAAENLHNLHAESSSQLGRLENIVRDIITESSDRITNGINSVASTLKIKSTNIMDALDDSVAQRDNLEEKIGDSFTDLTNEIKGLKRVEQVMINTADAVLDTKRSIEFGIQQVIIELSDIVRHSGSTINSTLSDKINDISFAILKNQTSALTNMTAKMEREISQVWRQIGVMYQEVAQSVNILDDLQSTTSQQMNASLNQVNHMDGTVGKINSKVAGVEDDLNYLLGRLSLVVNEFKHLKVGVGEELQNLRNMAEEFSDGEIVEYKVKSDQKLPVPQ